MYRNKLYPKWLRDLVELLEGLVESKRCKPIVRQHRKIGRNERCRCSSGMRYKHCCWSKDVKKGIR